MCAAPVLLVTDDDALWRHWRTLGDGAWLPARGVAMADMNRWRRQERSLVLLDAGLARLPDWSDAVWADHFSELKIVVASMRPSDEEGKKALAAGASGYIHAYSPPGVLSSVLKTVAAGGVWLGQGLLSRLLNQLDSALPHYGEWHEGLTSREKEVAQRAAMGHSNQAIADALSISERTVRAHLSAVFEKLGVTDRLFLALKVHGIK